MQITAAAVFIKDSKILLEKRRDDEDNYAGFWALPGGHNRKGETLQQTLKREMKEELNIEVTEDKFIGKFKDKDPTSKKMYAHNAFLCMEWEGKIKKTKEQKKIEWVELKNIKSLEKIRPIDLKILKKAGLL